jgi:flagellar hook assembly protein FlgD
VSWGYPNGSHTVTAADCSDAVTCGTPSAATPFELANDAPVITAPASGASVRGGFTITATSSGGGLSFLVDDVQVGFDAAAPYTFNYRGTALTQGSHTVQAVQCSTDAARCDGPTSAAVAFSATVLHPSLSSVAPNPFSPNRDGVKDSTKVTIVLSESQSVRLSVITSGGSTVRTVNLGALSSGTHYWTWNGKRADGSSAGNGTYTVRATTSKTVNGVPVPGTASRTVRLDTVAPALSSVSGNGSTFYPYRDGYRDTFTPGVTLGEAGTLKLIVRNSAGRAVRTLQASRSAGRTSLTWNGRDSANGRVAAGTYYWTYTAADTAGNHRTTARYGVHVSDKRLVGKTATITKNGDSHYAVKTNATSCVQYSDGLSNFSHGVWLDNFCDPDYDGFAIIDAFYNFTVPAAVKYGTMSVKAYGSPQPSNLPVEIFALYYNTSGGAIAKIASVSSAVASWHGFAGVSGTGRVSGSHVAKVSVGVDNYTNSGGYSSDFDMASVRLTIRYFVLQ